MRSTDKAESGSSVRNGHPILESSPEQLWKGAHMNVVSMHGSVNISVCLRLGHNVSLHEADGSTLTSLRADYGCSMFTPTVANNNNNYNNNNNNYYYYYDDYDDDDDYYYYYYYYYYYHYCYCYCQCYSL